MTDWREISGDQNLRLSQKVLEQQGEINDLKAELKRLTDSEDSRVVVLEAENKRLKEELHQLANDLDAAGEALKATAEGYRFSADAQARMAEMDRLRAENRMLRTKSTRLESENKLLRDELGSARDWEAWERKEAEIKKLRAECAEYDEANTDLGIALAEARAELDRTKPVVDAAEEWYAAFECEELDENYSAEERVLFNTIKANPSCPSRGPGGCAGHTRKPSEVERKLPVCAQCGHRHRWGGECADHSWTDACPYDADANCEVGHTKSTAEEPSGGISEMTMAAIAAYARATGMIPSEAAAEGLSSTDTTAVGRG